MSTSAAVVTPAIQNNYAPVRIDTFFRPGETRFFGGNHRQDQYSELLAKAGIAFDYTPLDTDSVPRWKAAIAALTHLADRRFFRSPHLLRKLGYAGKVWVAVDQYLRTNPGAKCLLSEATSRWAVSILAVRKKLPLIAIPQHVESMGVGPGHETLFHNGQLYGLEFEVEQYKRAAAVFCISDEEQWLLANLGVKSDVLPFYPADALAGELLAVRARRSAEPQGGYLVMGNPGFIANRVGMMKVLENLGPAIQGTAVTMDVVGAGTVELFGHHASSNIRVHGYLATDKLHELQVNARGLILHQEWGGGALTRIPEALIAGLPVLANSLCGRTFRHLAGVYRYDNWDELVDLVMAGVPSPPAPPHPDKAERRFIDSVRGLAGLPREQPV